jgi:lipopolysaccharide transport system ATP-binding protein
MKGKEDFPIVEVNELSKIYRVYQKPIDRLKELFFSNGKKYSFTVKALDNISFAIEKGDRLGILGENGSGKSTLLKVLSHVLTPTSGTYSVRGKVSSLLEMGTGFNPELTGRENFYQNGMVYGYTKRELNDRFNLVHDFSELDDFIHQPVKNYSSGMFVRLAFSCAIFVDPEILIIDEALSVGDIYFQSKCYYKIKSLIDNGVTFIYVSHNPDSIKSLCNKGIFLHKGKIEHIGDSEYVSNCYNKYFFEKKNRSKWYVYKDKDEKEKDSDKAELLNNNSKSYKVNNITNPIEFKVSEKFKNRVKQFRGGTGNARITAVELINSLGKITEEIKFGEKAAVRVYIKYAVEPKENFSIGVGFRDIQGIEIFHFFTLSEGVTIGGNDISREVVEFQFVNKLTPGDYTIAIGLADMVPSVTTPPYYDVDVVADYCPGCYQFKVPYDIEKPIWGKVGVPFTIKKYLVKN